MQMYCRGLIQMEYPSRWPCRRYRKFAIWFSRDTRLDLICLDRASQDQHRLGDRRWLHKRPAGFLTVVATTVHPQLVARVVSFRYEDAKWRSPLAKWVGFQVELC
jgi:hypothetical protein